MKKQLAIKEPECLTYVHGLTDQTLSPGQSIWLQVYEETPFGMGDMIRETMICEFPIQPEWGLYWEAYDRVL